MPETKSPLTVAAIDVGSSAIRMDISELYQDGKVRTIETLSKGVSLGKDAFTDGKFGEETIQTACQALIDYQKMLKAYGITKYRAVATSAVREASNSDTFIDRVFLRSGLEIEVIDGSEENRLTYMAIHEAVAGLLDLQSINALVVEVGGGSTDISFLKQGELLQSGTYPLGSVRLRQDLHGVKGDLKQKIRILERQIKNTVQGIAATIPFGQAQELIALGGDIRFAARQISGEAQSGFWILNKKDFLKFCTDVVKFEQDELVRRYSLSYPQAETLVPALLGYKTILERTAAERVYVLSASIRAGILIDMARSVSGKELESFDRQIIASARTLAEKYHSNQAHIEQVRIHALSLFDQLQLEHGLDPRDRLFLEVAAILHNVGYFISSRAHHKHTYYVISSSEVFGLSRNDLNIIANIARYHRKAVPSASHLTYISLDRESRVLVSKLAAILRVADALDQDASSKVHKLRVFLDEERAEYVLEAEAEGDLVMEALWLERKGDLFQAIFGKPLVLRQVERIE